MNLFHWVRQPFSERPQKETERVIRRCLTRFDLPVVDVQKGMWAVVAAVENTYRVSLYLWADEFQIRMQAAAHLTMERGLVLREVAVTLLEENHRFDGGSFRLSPCNEERTIVLGRTVDRRYFPEAELPRLGETLIDRMQRMICKLHGLGLIVDGPEPRRETHQKK